MTCDSQSITYEAKFEDGSASIVKEVRSVDRSNEVFDKELQCLGRLHHRHVVALRGFSIGRRRFDPYSYNISMIQWLHSSIYSAEIQWQLAEKVELQRYIIMN